MAMPSTGTYVRTCIGARSRVLECSRVFARVLARVPPQVLLGWLARSTQFPSGPWPRGRYSTRGSERSARRGPFVPRVRVRAHVRVLRGDVRECRAQSQLVGRREWIYRARSVDRTVSNRVYFRPLSRYRPRDTGNVDETSRARGTSHPRANALLNHPSNASSFFVTEDRAPFLLCSSFSFSSFLLCPSFSFSSFLLLISLSLSLSHFLSLSLLVPSN